MVRGRTREREREGGWGEGGKVAGGHQSNVKAPDDQRSRKEGEPEREIERGEGGKEQASPSLY